MRTLIYLDENQGYGYLPYIFKTDCDWSVQKLRELSFSDRAAGRIATSFERFCELLIAEGFKCERIYENLISKEDFDRFNCVVEGAPGNY